ncbi:MAG TPA: DUF1097 domain-containing protein [Bacilli bacterium]|jgi:hypothetical protein|nr:DUF1097 domain-containing protein [Bacilli bacterium]
MKINRSLLFAAVGIALVAAVWQVLAIFVGNTSIGVNYPAVQAIGIPAFLGWASYYIAGGKFSTQIKATITNLSGTFWGVVMMAIIVFFASRGWNQYLGGGLALLVGAFFIVFQAHIKYIGNIPLMFMGSTAFFAVYNGQWIESIIVVIIGLFCGGFLGLFGQKIGEFLDEKVFKKTGK